MPAVNAKINTSLNPHWTIAVPPSPVHGRLKRSLSNLQEIPLLAETVLVAACVIIAVKFMQNSPLANVAWLVVPCILVASALLPAWIRKADFPKTSLERKNLQTVLIPLCLSCALAFPVMFLSMWLLKSYGLGLPLQDALPNSGSWLCWLFYQFAYVAVGEEFFFRGYVQNNLSKAAGTLMRERQDLQDLVSIISSATLFAVAHIIVQGQPMSVLAFLPGIVLGWLFVRTKSLLAPILFHGLANTFYCVTASILF